MSWRRVIQILGGLCIGVGVLSMCNNFSEMAAGLIGPGIQADAEASLPGFMQDSSKANASALEHSVYRVYLVIQGAMDGVMAMLLIAGGIGLIRVSPWGRRLGLVCGGYALATSAVYVVMMNIYMLPEVIAQSAQPMPNGVGVVVSLFLLLVLWAFPTALLTVLMLPGAKQAIREAGHQARQVSPATHGTTQTTPATHGLAPSAAGTESAPAQPTEAHHTPQPGPPMVEAPHASDAPPHVPAALQTWRDDPWNDPEAT